MSELHGLFAWNNETRDEDGSMAAIEKSDHTLTMKLGIWMVATALVVQVWHGHRKVEQEQLAAGGCANGQPMVKQWSTNGRPMVFLAFTHLPLWPRESTTTLQCLHRQLPHAGTQTRCFITNLLHVWSFSCFASGPTSIGLLNPLLESCVRIL